MYSCTSADKDSNAFTAGTWTHKLYIRIYSESTHTSLSTVNPHTHLHQYLQWIHTHTHTHTHLHQYLQWMNTHTHTHTHTRLLLWIVETFHRLLLLLYWFLSPKPTPYRKLVCTAILSDKHHLHFIFSLVGTADRSPKCKKKSGFVILVGTFGPHNVA